MINSIVDQNDSETSSSNSFIYRYFIGTLLLPLFISKNRSCHNDNLQATSVEWNLAFAFALCFCFLSDFGNLSDTIKRAANRTKTTR